MTRLLNSTNEVRPTVERFFAHLEKVSQLSADEWVATARYYEMTDVEQSARADNDYQAIADLPVPKVGD